MIPQTPVLESGAKVRREIEENRVRTRYAYQVRLSMRTWYGLQKKLPRITTRQPPWIYYKNTMHPN